VETFPADLALPNAFWISVDPALPLAMWHKSIGSYTSAAWSVASANAAYRERYIDGEIDYLMFERNQAYDAAALSTYSHGVAVNYMVEYNAEHARRQINPTLPSRLSAVYAFGTKADAVRAARAADRPRWEVYAFSLVEAPLTRVARVNMNVVSLMRFGTRVGSFDAEESEVVWRHYWSGKGELRLELPSGPMFESEIHDSGVVWEYLIEGRLELLDRRH
jgi:hypothetical protein